jgi:hypothetical protein
MQAALLNIETMQRLELIGMTLIPPMEGTCPEYEEFLKNPFKTPDRTFNQIRKMRENNISIDFKEYKR